MHTKQDKRKTPEFAALKKQQMKEFWRIKHGTV